MTYIYKVSCISCNWHRVYTNRETADNEAERHERKGYHHATELVTE